MNPFDDPAALAAASTEAHPDATGLDVLHYLRATGTGPSRVELVELFLQNKPDASGSDVLGLLIGYRVQPGTINKVGQFIHGPAYNYADPSAAPVGDDVTRLRQEVAELKRQLKEQEAKAVFLSRENRLLQSRIAALAGTAQTEAIRGLEAGSKAASSGKKRSHHKAAESKAPELAGVE